MQGVSLRWVCLIEAGLSRKCHYNKCHHRFESKYNYCKYATNTSRAKFFKNKSFKQFEREKEKDCNG